MDIDVHLFRKIPRFKALGNFPFVIQNIKSRSPQVPTFFRLPSQRQLRYIEWVVVKIYVFQKVTIFTLFKLYNAGLGVLIPKRYNMLG